MLKFNVKYPYYTLLISFLFLSNTLIGQGEANVWYFGHQLGLDFSNTIPKSLVNGKLSSIEGCATMADANGKLLFYTEGVNVWNRNHQLMPHGKGLKGHKSSTQSALIVPKPGDLSSYYIFTTDEAGYLDSPNDGLHYSQVNMCLQDGLGDVVPETKNTFLFAPSTEKLAAVKHQNGIDYWVVIHEMGTNKFLAYLVTENGINHTPIVSKIGKKHSYSENPNHSLGEDTTYYAIGQMKFSPDGAKLGVAILKLQYLGIFDFDIKTGQVSNPIEFINHPCYTFEFSPNGSKLYTNYYTETIYELKEAIIYQYDLQAGSSEDVKSSEETVFMLQPEYFQDYTDYAYIYYHRGYKALRGFQLGKDGKIYVLALALDSYPQYTNGFKLAVIEQPNLKGKACKFTPIVINIAPETSSISYLFPTFVSSFLNPAAQIKYSYSCPSTNLQLYLAKKGSKVVADSIQSIIWKIEDSTYTTFSPTHNFSEAGTKSVQASVVWIDGEKQLLTQNVYLSKSWNLSLGKDTTLYDTQTYRLDVSAIGGISTWQDGSTNSFYVVDKPGLYWVRVCKNGCTAIDSINVTFSKTPKIDLGKDLIICNGEPVKLSVDFPFTQVHWSNGVNSSSITVNHTGTYWVQVENVCGMAIDTIDIIYEDGPELNLGPDTILCAGKTLLLNIAHPNAVSYFWQGKIGGPTFIVNEEGNYIAQIRNKYCMVTDTIYVQFIECLDKLKVPNVFTPNQDGVNDFFEVSGILPNRWKLIICNRLGKVIYQSNGYNNDWNGEGQDNGMYYYYIINPSTGNKLKGWVHLIR